MGEKGSRSGTTGADKGNQGVVWEGTGAGGWTEGVLGALEFRGLR